MTLEEQMIITKIEILLKEGKEIPQNLKQALVDLAKKYEVPVSKGSYEQAIAEGMDVTGIIVE